MAQLIVRNLEESVKAALQERARIHGHSMEEEARQILRLAAREPARTPAPMGTQIAALFAGDGLDAPLPELRGEAAQAMDLGA